jgi:hypothetical protein
MNRLKSRLRAVSETHGARSKEYEEFVKFPGARYTCPS